MNTCCMLFQVLRIHLLKCSAAVARQIVCCVATCLLLQSMTAHLQDCNVPSALTQQAGVLLIGW